MATDPSGNEVHYRLLSTTRAYALEKLKLGGEEESAALCHAVYFRDLARKAQADWETVPAAQWLQIYGRAIDDMRARDRLGTGFRRTPCDWFRYHHRDRPALVSTFPDG